MPFLFEIVLNHFEGLAYVAVTVEYGELNSIVSAEQQSIFLFRGNFHVSHIYTIRNSLRTFFFCVRVMCCENNFKKMIFMAA